MRTVTCDVCGCAIGTVPNIAQIEIRPEHGSMRKSVLWTKDLCMGCADRLADMVRAYFREEEK